LLLFVRAAAAGAARMLHYRERCDFVRCVITARHNGCDVGRFYLSEVAGLKMKEASNARHDTSAAYASLLGEVDARSRRLGRPMSEAEALQKRLGARHTA